MQAREPGESEPLPYLRLASSDLWFIFCRCGQSCPALPPWQMCLGAEIRERKWGRSRGRWMVRLGMERDGSLHWANGYCGHVAQILQDCFSFKYSALPLPLKINCTIQAIGTSGSETSGSSSPLPPLPSLFIADILKNLKKYGSFKYKNRSLQYTLIYKWLFPLLVRSWTSVREISFILVGSLHDLFNWSPTLTHFCHF